MPSPSPKPRMRPLTTKERQKLSTDTLSKTWWYAISAAGVSGGLKLFIPIPGIDVVPLTAITMSMCNDIAALHNYDSLKGLSQFFGVIIGAASGMKLATELTTVIPVVGAGANAAATFTLHMVTGVTLLIIFLLIRDGAIEESFIKNSPIGTISQILGFATEVVGNVLRGQDGGKAIEEAIKNFKFGGATPSGHPMGKGPLRF